MDRGRKSSQFGFFNSLGCNHAINYTVRIIVDKLTITEGGNCATINTLTYLSSVIRLLTTLCVIFAAVRPYCRREKM